MIANKTTTNLIWRFLERIAAQGVTFIVAIILARLLEPSIYGTVALITVFTALLQVFVDSGFGTALIQKHKADNIDFSTVFFFNITICIFLYTAMFFVAPLIANYYDIPELTTLVRVLSLTLVISGVKNIQQAYVSKHLLFKKFFFATIGGTIVSAVVGIYMAYRGFGVWALVAQTLTNQTIDTLILWMTVKWRPLLVFSWGRLKSLFSFGWKLLVSALIDTGYRELRALIIGKKYSKSDLAFYEKGQQFPNLIVTNINSSIDSVLLPAMASVQDDRERVRLMTRRAIKTSTYIMMPLLMGLAVCAEPLVRLLLTEKWMESVPYLRIFCFTYAFYPIHTANLNAIRAMGRSDLILKLEIAKKAIGLAAILISMWFGVIWIACSLVVTTFTSQALNAYPNKKLLNYSYLDQIKDMLPQSLLSTVMGTVMLVLQFFRLSDVLTLTIQIISGVIIYLSLSRLFKLESFEYVVKIMKPYLKIGKNK